MKIHTKSKRLKMSFGKYQGRGFSSIPSDYLKWLLTLNNISEEIKDEANIVLMDRAGYKEIMRGERGKNDK